MLVVGREEVERADHSVTNMPVVLLDCDGVLVDNVRFEQRVTQLIVQWYASQSKLTFEEAELRWGAELSSTRGDPLWYDYAYHCDRLGIDGQSVSKWAHREAAGLLTIVPGAIDTYALLQSMGVAIGVVSDATRWVVEFKLNAVGLTDSSIVFSSTDAASTKATKVYWETLARQLAFFRPLVLIDNRKVNLLSAKAFIQDLHLVRFVHDEHVTTLPASVSPRPEIASQESIAVVHNHDELQRWMTGLMG